jgi:hypothetical protein
MKRPTGNGPRVALIRAVHLSGLAAEDDGGRGYVRAGRHRRKDLVAPDWHRPGQTNTAWQLQLTRLGLTTLTGGR